MAKSRPKIILTDIGVTIVVFMVAAVMLGVTNYRNHQAGNALDYQMVKTNITIARPELGDTIYLFDSGNETRQTFPRFTKTIDWDKRVLLAYVASPQPTAGYQFDLTSAHRQGPVATLRYRLRPPLTTLPSGAVQPVLFVTLERAELVSSSQFTFRLQNIETNQTASLSVPFNEL